MFVRSNNETHTTMNTNHNTESKTITWQMDKGTLKVFHTPKNTDITLIYAVKREVNGWTIYHNNEFMACVSKKNDAIRCIQMATPSNLSR
jgi:hypothetical protein